MCVAFHHLDNGMELPYQQSNPCVHTVQSSHLMKYIELKKQPMFKAPILDI